MPTCRRHWNCIGRDSIAVQATVAPFVELGISLVVLQLGNLDLTSSSGALLLKEYRTGRASLQLDVRVLDWVGTSPPRPGVCSTWRRSP
jgi:hypothetical protein